MAGWTAYSDQWSGVSMTTSVCGLCADAPSSVTVCGGLCGATVGVAGRPGPGPGEAFPPAHTRKGRVIERVKCSLPPFLAFLLLYLT